MQCICRLPRRLQASQPQGHAQPSCPTHYSLHYANDVACTAFCHIARAHDRLPRSPYGLGVCGQAALQPFIYAGFRGVCPQSLY